MKTPILFIFILGLFIHSCGDSNDQMDQEAYFENQYSTVKDNGKYCGVIEYFPDGDEDSQLLETEVEVVSGMLTKVHSWPDGIWEDSDDFVPIQLINGHSDFQTDKGIRVDIEVMTPGSCN